MNGKLTGQEGGLKQVWIQLVGIEQHLVLHLHEQEQVLQDKFLVQIF
jgi:hypothetical protein